MFSVQLFTFIYKTRVVTFNRNIINQSAFYTNDRINCHSARVANAARIVNFDILRDDENDIDSSSDSLQVEISIKRVLENIIATINNQFAKKRRKRFKNSKIIARFDALSRVDFSVFSYAFRRSASAILFFRIIKHSFIRIAARAIRFEIEQTNQKNE